MAERYVVTFDPRPIAGPGAIAGLRVSDLAYARETVRLALPYRHGRIVDADTLEVAETS